MPSADQHRKKVQQNRNFLNSINLNDYPDWVVVAAFYVAVHLVEQLRHALGEGDSTSHEERRKYVQARHPDIHAAYAILENASRLARYESNADFYKQFQREDIAEKILGKYLPKVDTYVAEKLAQQAAK